MPLSISSHLTVRVSLLEMVISKMKMVILQKIKDFIKSIIFRGYLESHVTGRAVNKLRKKN